MKKLSFLLALMLLVSCVALPLSAMAEPSGTLIESVTVNLDMEALVSQMKIGNDCLYHWYDVSEYGEYNGYVSNYYITGTQHWYIVCEGFIAKVKPGDSNAEVAVNGFLPLFLIKQGQENDATFEYDREYGFWVTLEAEEGYVFDKTTNIQIPNGTIVYRDDDEDTAVFVSLGTIEEIQEKYGKKADPPKTGDEGLPMVWGGIILAAGAAYIQLKKRSVNA